MKLLVIRFNQLNTNIQHDQIYFKNYTYLQWIKKSRLDLVKLTRLNLKANRGIKSEDDVYKVLMFWGSPLIKSGFENKTVEKISFIKIAQKTELSYV